MSTSVADIVTVPFKCDAEFTKCWYGDQIEDLGGKKKDAEKNTARELENELKGLHAARVC